MKNDIAFAFKISFFNAIGFSVTAASTTYLDARLTSHVVYGARNYPFGYIACALGLFIFSVTFICMAKTLSLKTLIYGPALILLLFGVVSLPVFLPEFPHGNIVFWIPMYSLISGVSCWIRHSPSVCPYLSNSTIPDHIKLERVKESVTFWRTISASMAFGYIAILFPWTNFIWDFTQKLVTVPKERFLLGTFTAVQLAVFSAYVLAAVICEGFKKAISTADLMLDIKKEPGITEKEHGKRHQIV